MKYVASLLLVWISFNAAACDNYLNISKDAKIGTWKSIDDPFDVTVTYRSDGTFVGNIVESGKVVWEYEGIWKIIDDTNYTNYTKSSSDRVPVGTKDQDKIISIGCGIYTYQSQYGKIKRYRRVQ